MEIFVFNKQFEILGIIDTFKSLIWRREYHKAGSFEFHLSLPAEDDEAAYIVSLLKKGNILVKEDSPEEAVLIVGIKLEDQTSETLIVTGYSIGNLLFDRLVWGEMSKQGNIEIVMKHFVEKNGIVPDHPNRVIPYLTNSPNTGINKTANEVNSYGNLEALIEELALKHDVGWRVLFDLSNQQYVFDVYEGRDLSINQSVNPRAIFSLEYENVLQQTYTDNDAAYRNMALVAGQGEGNNRKKVFINDSLAGFNRKEMYVDARDLSNVKEDETVMTDEEYQALLGERGTSRLAESRTIQTYESGISVRSNLIYKQDFDLGDIVTVVNDRWGILLNTRITSIEEVYENDTVDILVNFGSNIPTLIDRIQQKMR